MDHLIPRDRPFVYPAYFRAPIGNPDSVRHVSSNETTYVVLASHIRESHMPCASISPPIAFTMSKIIVDLHCHPSLKAFHNTSIKDIWESFENKKRKELFDADLKERLISCGLKNEIDALATFSQSNLEACFKGGNRLLFTTIYPVERPFVRPDRPFDSADIHPRQKQKLMQLFYRKRGKEPDFKIDIKLIQAITGFSESQAKSYIAEINDPEAEIDYFQDFIGEYHLLKEAQNQDYPSNATSKPIKFKLIDHYGEIEQLKDNEIAAIPNIEGAHSLGTYKAKDLLRAQSIDTLRKSDRDRLEGILLERVAILKGTKKYQFQQESHFVEHPPFYLTLSHHFNNLIAGHAQSFKGPSTSNKPGFNQIFNQQHGLNGGLTETGEKVIKALLSRKKGRRILLDTKHMSIETRRSYHGIVRNEFKDVPIICSHTAVNGLTDFREAIVQRGRTKRDLSSYISRADINLTDEDIRDIYDSNGIIGICMHDGRMPGGKFKRAVEEAQGPFDNVRIARINRFYAQLFLMNVFHVVRVNKRHIEALHKMGREMDIRTAWDTICLGTDHDGIIDPFNHLSTAASLEDFKNICIDALEHRDSEVRKKEGSQIRLIDHTGTFPMSKGTMEELMMGISPKLLMEKVFSENIMVFLKKYFRPDYLSQQTKP